jgi:hypothetical protein
VNSDGIVAIEKKAKFSFYHFSSSVIFHAFVQIIDFDSKEKEKGGTIAQVS